MLLGLLLGGLEVVLQMPEDHADDVSLGHGVQETPHVQPHERDDDYWKKRKTISLCVIQLSAERFRGS